MIKKLLENQQKGRTPCHAVLGDDKAIKAFAEFWHLHGDKVQLIATHSLIEFTSSAEGFSKEDSVYYKKGLSEIPRFMEKCWQELNREALQDSKSSDGL